MSNLIENINKAIDSRKNIISRNIQGSINIEKAYEPGVYSDTPENRKLNRVGQRYGAEHGYNHGDKAKRKEFEEKQSASHKAGDIVKVTDGNGTPMEGVVRGVRGNDMFLWTPTKNLQINMSLYKIEKQTSSTDPKVNEIRDNILGKKQQPEEEKKVGIILNEKEIKRVVDNAINSAKSWIDEEDGLKGGKVFDTEEHDWIDLGNFSKMMIGRDQSGSMDKLQEKISDPRYSEKFQILSEYIEENHPEEIKNISNGIKEKYFKKQ